LAAVLATVVMGAGTASAEPIGGGLNGQVNYTQDFAFVDAMKTAGKFRAVTGDGQIDFDNDAPVDERGWPTTDFAVYVNETAPPLGTYHLSFVTANRPEVRIPIHPGQVENLNWDAGTGRGTADIVLTGEGEHFALMFTGTGNGNGGARDIRLIRPGYDPTNPPTFTTEYLSHLRSLDPTVLRFMDWTQTNSNVVSHWSERTQPIDASQTAELTRTVPAREGGTVDVTSGKGVAWEYAIELANTIGADAWVNVPTLADDDYVTNLARLIRDTLRPDLHVWVEYGNELWNSGFDQWYWNLDAARDDPSLNDDGDADIYLMAQRRAARRTVQVSDIFAREFGTGVGASSRFRPVLANQYDNPFLVTDQLDFIQRTIGAPSGRLYAIANAPYFSIGEADERTDLTADDVLAGLSAAVDDIDTNGKLEQWMALGADRGLTVAAYEGGPDTFGPNNIAAKRDASLDPRMQTLMERYLRIWYAKGGSQFNWFTLGAGSYDTRYGTWSITNDINNQDTPKMRAFRTIRRG
jgi:hypothetical protein